MSEFGPDTYGDAFADVYDEWYSDVSDVEATVDFVHRRCGHGRIVELGAGTGRLAVPLAASGPGADHGVVGVDASAAMLRRCPSDTPALHLVQADLAHLPVVGPIGAALCAFNTLFNLPVEAQGTLLGHLGQHLAPDGVVIIEAITGHELADGPGSSVGVSRIEPERLVLSATKLDRTAQRITGQHVDITESGIRLRPWQLRWTTPDQLDAMAEQAGLVLRERFEDVAGAAFTSTSQRHVSVYSNPG